MRSNSIDNAGAFRTFANSKLGSEYFKYIEVYCVANHQNRSVLQHKIMLMHVLLDYDAEAIEDQVFWKNWVVLFLDSQTLRVLWY